MWMPKEANIVPQRVQARVQLLGSGASQPTAEPRAEVVKCAGKGECLFTALSFAKVCCIDGKARPDQGLPQLGAGGPRLSSARRSGTLKFLCSGARATARRFYSFGPEGQHLMCDQLCFSTRAVNITTFLRLSAPAWAAVDAHMDAHLPSM